ncbi:septum formation initiator family protein [Tersicoccus sp. MR15.9]|uniref:septum formation initiator family protein n=1 Tax=Tersicoccus mangrovi TaxID=3121635 RepID=UPI002FE65230
MSTRRPNVPRTGPAAEPRRTGDVDGVSSGTGSSAAASGAGSTAARPPRSVTSALPVTPRASSSRTTRPSSHAGSTRPASNPASTDGPAPHGSSAAPAPAHERGGARLLWGLRGDRDASQGSGRREPGQHRPGRGRKEASATSTTPTRYTVRREDGRVNYAFTDAGPRPAAAGSTAVRPVPAKAFSGRLLALALVLVTITILLAPTVRTYLGQRAEINDLKQSISSEQAQQAQLKDQLARWNDPAYVKQQARDRLFYVMPGETGYLVIGAGNTDEVPPVATSAESDSGPQPWLDALWTSVKGSAAQQQQQTRH